MRMRLSDPTDGDIIVDRQLPNEFATGGFVGQSEFRIDHRLGSANIRDMWFDGIHLLFGKIRFDEDISVKAECDTPMIEMHFGLSGRSSATYSGSFGDMIFEPNQHNVCYFPEFEGYFHSRKQTELYNLLEVHITERYFKRFINPESRLMDTFLNRIERKEVSSLNPRNMQITFAMQSILAEIAGCQRTGVMKRMFLEARLMELLMLQMEQFDSDHRQVQLSTGANRVDTDKLHMARHILEQNISAPHSLTELSRAVGLNDFKLKKGFRELFGTTVFGYLHQLRMEQARRLLQDTSKTISDISEYCGYAYVSHFTTAFRKQFGVTPGAYR